MRCVRVRRTGVGESECGAPARSSVAPGEPLLPGVFECREVVEWRCVWRGRRGGCRYFAVGFGVSREEDGIAVGHRGDNEGYQSEFVGVPHLGQGVVVLTNSDNGHELTAVVVDEVASQFGWPWTGWATPLWMFLLALGLVAVGVVWIVRRRPRLGVVSADDD